jgi:hypothetical protein
MDALLEVLFALQIVVALTLLGSIVRLLYKVVDLCDHVIRREDVGEDFNDNAKEAEQLG